MSAATVFFDPSNPYLGFAAIEHALALRPIQPLTTTAKVGGIRQEAHNKGFTTTVFPASYAPQPTLRGHFEFGLKYDELQLEWLARLFDTQGPDWLETWLRDSPSSIYARRAGCLYEWMTGRSLDVPDSRTSNYGLLIDPDQYLAATEPLRDRRWKLENNLPGTPAYCPLVRWTPQLRAASAFQLGVALARLDSQFGDDLLMRSAAWLTFAESRASFAIERESDHKDDIRRFATAMSLHCGSIEEPLSPESLTVLQREVLGTRALRTGVRRSPVFIGSSAHFGVTTVRYVAPPAGQVPALLEGLRAFEQKTRGASPLVRAAALAFGFVYIHPLSDGNGRVHRLLINDTLLRDGAVPAGTILPVSATILERGNHAEYERVLNSLSARQMKRHGTDWSFSDTETECPDGVWTNFEFRADAACMPFWRFPDLTWHSQYICEMLKQTVEKNMTDEAAYLARHDRAMLRLKRVCEMPDRDAERIIRSLRENHGKVTKLLGARYPTLFCGDEALRAEIIEAVISAFEIDAADLAPAAAAPPQAP